jgi:hypothetical protein
VITPIFPTIGGDDMSLNYPISEKSIVLNIIGEMKLSIVLLERKFGNQWPLYFSPLTPLLLFVKVDVC